MPEALDPVPLLRHLREHGVEHIAIGGLAVSAHGHVRTSQDLDVVPNPVHENLERLAAALADTDENVKCWAVKFLLARVTPSRRAGLGTIGPVAHRLPLGAWVSKACGGVRRV
jgi:hypothetical protein